MQGFKAGIVLRFGRKDKWAPLFLRSTIGVAGDIGNVFVVEVGIILIIRPGASKR